MRNLLTLLTAVSVLAPSIALAAPVIRGNVLTPAGLCDKHQDGTLGVRFDGTSYTAFLAEYAADKVALAAAVEMYKFQVLKDGGAPATEMQVAQLTAKIKKDAATLQRMRVNQGQDALCR
jgi:hypothetical protein